MDAPPLGFTLQDSAQPIPNLNTNLLVGDTAEVTCNYPLLPMDFVNIYMLSPLLGGDHNQSFSIKHAAPSLVAQIPKSRVETNEGSSVRLRVNIRRNGGSLVAPDAIVTINKRPIVTPPPTTLWNFDDNTFQGWVPQGSYIGGKLRVINGQVTADVSNSVSGSSHIITRTVPVIAGQRYRCSCEVHTDLPVADGSRLHMTMNGLKIGVTAAVVPGSVLSGSGEFTAPVTGTVHLGIFNEAVPNGRHQLFIDQIQISPIT